MQKNRLISILVFYTRVLSKKSPIKVLLNFNSTLILNYHS